MRKKLNNDLTLSLDGSYELMLLIIAYLVPNRTSLSNDNFMVFFVSTANLCTLMEVEKKPDIFSFSTLKEPITTVLQSSFRITVSLVTKPLFGNWASC